MQSLTDTQYNELWSAYESARMCDAGGSGRRGEHAILIQLLVEYGFNVGSVMDAYAVCERIFGW